MYNHGCDLAASLLKECVYFADGIVALLFITKEHTYHCKKNRKLKPPSNDYFHAFSLNNRIPALRFLQCNKMYMCSRVEAGIMRQVVL